MLLVLFGIILIHLWVKPITYLAWNSSTVSLPPQTLGSRRPPPPREWGQTFQPTLASGTQSSDPPGTPLSGLWPWFASFPHLLPRLQLTWSPQPSASSPQSNEVLQDYPPWGKGLLILLTVFSILPIPAYFLYVLLHRISPRSARHRRNTSFFKHNVKVEKQKAPPRLPAVQSLKKMNKNR